MTEARKRANEKWSKENMITLSTRVNKKDKAALVDKLKPYNMSVHTFIKNCVMLYLADDESLMRMLEGQGCNP